MFTPISQLFPPPLPLLVHTFVLYICVFISSLQIGSRPFLILDISVKFKTREKNPHGLSKSELGFPVWLWGRALSFCLCFQGKRGDHVRSPCTEFRRNSGIHTPAVSPFCLFSFSYSLPALRNLPFQPVQLKITRKHDLGNPKGPLGPI